MKKYKIEETTEMSREAKIEFPNWNLYPAGAVERAIEKVLKDIGIDLKFCMTEVGIETDPQNDYTILTTVNGFYIVKEHRFLTITFKDEFNGKVEI